MSLRYIQVVECMYSLFLFIIKQYTTILFLFPQKCFIVITPRFIDIFINVSTCITVLPSEFNFLLPKSAINLSNSFSEGLWVLNSFCLCLSKIILPPLLWMWIDISKFNFVLSQNSEDIFLSSKFCCYCSW